MDLNIGISAYLITGRADPRQRLDRRPLRRAKVFALALAIFTLASVLCGLSTTLDQFVAMRVLQGMGGALMVPVGRGRATHHAKTSAHHGNRHPDVACAGRADHRPTAGWVHYQLCRLALDLLY